MKGKKMAAQICMTCEHKHEICYCSPNSTCKNYKRDEAAFHVSDCKQGVHPFEIIAKFENCWHETKVVRWCPECGAVVVDLVYDGRTKPGYYRKLQYPNIVYKHGLE